jgi:hypothetical protein
VSSLSRYRAPAWICIAALAFAGCTRQVEPARRSLGDIQAVVIAASAEASAYVPERLSAVQNQLGGLEAAFDKKDYAAVLAGAPAVMSAAQQLAGAAAAKKAERRRQLGEQWTDLAATLPDHVNAIQRRIDLLAAKSNKRSGSGGKHAPDIDLEAARDGLRTAESLWSKAQAAFATGNLDEAVATAKTVEAKIGALADALNLNLVPPATPAAA